MTRGVLAVVWVLAALVGCRPEAMRQCVPGAALQCPCPDGTGRAAAKTCGDDGKFGECVCTGAPVTTPSPGPTGHTDRPPAPTAQPAPPAADAGSLPMLRAQACRASTSNVSDRNECIINALSGRASTLQELGLLGVTQMADNRSADAVRTMRTYIQRYPDGPLVPAFEHYIEEHAPRGRARRRR